jgi:S1-C subfamily serine protease
MMGLGHRVWKVLTVVCLLNWGASVYGKAGDNIPMNYSQLRRSVFKIYVDSQQYQARQPWKQTRAERSSGSGFHIGNGRIMTNAHVVANGKYIALLRDGESEPMPAFVEFIAHDCDLAIIKPVNPQYLNNVTTLPFGDLPKAQSPVTTVGYARGGEQVSITQGVVSRIEFRRYVHSGYHRHILLQVDSAINPGNSGGPVFQGDRVIGVAFQAHTSAENTGYVIPNLVIQRFIKGIADGRYDGHPEDGMTIMTDVTRSEAVREQYRIPTGMSGVLVMHVASGSPAEGKVLPGDILVATDGHSIGSDGKISMGIERIDLNIVSDLKQTGETVQYDLIRNGKIERVGVPVAPFRPTYLPVNDYQRLPRYFVFGGHLFARLNRNILATWGNRWWQKAPLDLRYAHSFANYDPEFLGREDVIVYMGRLPHSSNSRSSGSEFGIVRSVNTEPTVSVRHLHEQLLKAPDDLVKIEFMFDGEPLVISRSKAQAAEAEILAQYGVDPAKWFDQEQDGAVTERDLQ